MKTKLSLLSILFALFLVACCDGAGQNNDMNEDKNNPWWSDATIYELNVRQFTQEGTFAAAEAELNRLRELGVDIIWMMPVQPIGEKERKGTLGSYYAIRDYKGVNPEFGDADDFRRFVDKAHSLGIKVILDWVANHTSPDAVWVANEGWHKRDENHNLVVNYDWYDIAELDYTNSEMRLAMIDAMLYWLNDMGVDGFRCDMAMLVPLDFWRQAKAELLKAKPDLFMLAEAEETWLVYDVFDMYYSWTLHHLMKDLATQKKNVRDLWHYFGGHNLRFPAKAIPMVFTSNHDENSHSDSEFVRFGDAVQTFAAFTYLVPSMPLIYTGQELGSTKRLEFFEKDNLEPNDAEGYTALYKSLNTLRKANPALWSGCAGSGIIKIPNDREQQVFSLRRIKDGNEVMAVFNLSASSVEVTLDDQIMEGVFSAYPDGSTVNFGKKQTFQLNPWEYRIYTRNK